MPTDKLVSALGEAVAAVWGKMPPEVQQAFFEEIGRRRLSWEAGNLPS
jgi:hypothetical protein